MATEVSNITVAVCLRRNNNSEHALCWDAETDRIVRKGSDAKEVTSYDFQHIFDDNASTRKIYSSCVAPIVQKSFSGYSGTILCYGESGSGKTYTMYVRDDENESIVWLAAEDIEREMRDVSRTHYFKITLLKIFEDMKECVSLEPHGSSEIVVYSADGFHDAMKKVMKSRSALDTDLGNHRKYLTVVLNITMDIVDASGSIHSSTLRFVDMAAANLSTVYDATKRAFHDLQHGAADAATDTSTLNGVLKDVVTEGVQIGLLCTIKPDSIMETREILDFASKLKNIQLNLRRGTTPRAVHDYESVAWELKSSLSAKNLEMEEIWKQLHVVSRFTCHEGSIPMEVPPSSPLIVTQGFSISGGSSYAQEEQKMELKEDDVGKSQEAVYEEMQKELEVMKAQLQNSEVREEENTKLIKLEFEQKLEDERRKAEENMKYIKLQLEQNLEDERSKAEDLQRQNAKLLCEQEQYGRVLTKCLGSWKSTLSTADAKIREIRPLVDGAKKRKCRVTNEIASSSLGAKTTGEPVLRQSEEERGHTSKSDAEHDGSDDSYESQSSDKISEDATDEEYRPGKRQRTRKSDRAITCPGKRQRTRKSDRAITCPGKRQRTRKSDRPITCPDCKIGYSTLSVARRHLHQVEKWKKSVADSWKPDIDDVVQ